MPCTTGSSLRLARRITSTSLGDLLTTGRGRGRASCSALLLLLLLLLALLVSGLESSGRGCVCVCVVQRTTCDARAAKKQQRRRRAPSCWLACSLSRAAASKRGVQHQPSGPPWLLAPRSPSSRMDVVCGACAVRSLHLATLESPGFCPPRARQSQARRTQTANRRLSAARSAAWPLRRRAKPRACFARYLQRPCSHGQDARPTLCALCHQQQALPDRRQQRSALHPSTSLPHPPLHHSKGCLLADPALLQPAGSLARVLPAYRPVCPQPGPPALVPSSHASSVPSSHLDSSLVFGAGHLPLSACPYLNFFPWHPKSSLVPAAHIGSIGPRHCARDRGRPVSVPDPLHHCLELRPPCPS